MYPAPLYLFHATFATIITPSHQSLAFPPYPPRDNRRRVAVRGPLCRHLSVRQPRAGHAGAHTARDIINASFFEKMRPSGAFRVSTDQRLLALLDRFFFFFLPGSNIGVKCKSQIHIRKKHRILSLLPDVRRIKRGTAIADDERPAFIPLHYGNVKPVCTHAKPVM